MSAIGLANWAKRRFVVRRLPVIQNTQPATGLAKTPAALALVVVAGFSWALLLWALARFGQIYVGVSCFGACVVAAFLLGRQIARADRRAAFARAALLFAVFVVGIALLGSTLSHWQLVAAAFLALASLSAAGFFVGGWFLTLRR